MTTEQWLNFVAFPLAAYVIGSTPFGVLIARAKGVDLRAAGSGNVGATNVGRVIGRTWGLICFFLDVLKGLMPVLAVGMVLQRDGELTASEQCAWLTVALAAVFGHVLSFWLKFRGGKGVATSLGVLLGLWPYFTVPAAVGLALWAAVTLKWRYVSLGSIVAAGVLPMLFVVECLIVGWPLAKFYPLLCFAVVAAGMVILRHRTNIVRLLRGQENKVGAKKTSPPESNEGTTTDE